ncbi:adenylate/guanylate cyclase domain-containing protein [Aureimonas sp. AU40]|uniref:adenylate/guanylate cyclase domain-containing protein n=1 Tax=Aureimonas sp. AU40 TaxID=1637747 RepID=UPI0035B507B9
MHMRIGINFGHVMVQDGDIFGDGVSIAARLETSAESGGICVTRGVRDHLRDRADAVFEDLGEHSVKNIARPVRVFRARFDINAEPIAVTGPAPLGGLCTGAGGNVWRNARPAGCQCRRNRLLGVVAGERRRRRISPLPRPGPSRVVRRPREPHAARSIVFVELGAEVAAFMQVSTASRSDVV